MKLATVFKGMVSSDEDSMKKVTGKYVSVTFVYSSVKGVKLCRRIKIEIWFGHHSGVVVAPLLLFGEVSDNATGGLRPQMRQTLLRRLAVGEHFSPVAFPYMALVLVVLSNLVPTTFFSSPPPFLCGARCPQLLTADVNSVSKTVVLIRPQAQSVLASIELVPLKTRSSLCKNFYC